MANMEIDAPVENQRDELPHQLPPFADILLLMNDEDIPFEEDLLRSPYVLKSWLRYIMFKIESPSTPTILKVVLYERALKHLPGSYKLWKQYLDYRRALAEDFESNDPRWEDVNLCFERALLLLHKMPRIWIDYCEMLVHQGKITRTRRTFDRALRALPVTQHDRIWEIYLPFVMRCGVVETALRVYRRYLKIAPEKVEVFVDFLVSNGRPEDAARMLLRAINSENFKSSRGKTMFQLWSELCDIICKHPKQIKNLRVEPILRSGIRKFADQVGKLWNALATYWILMGQFEKARNIYEEALASVLTVRDFTQVFEAYAEFEESIITAKMGAEGSVDDSELDLRFARFEKLLDRRPFLVNEVLLRQNPNNVLEWMKRVELFSDNQQKIIETYTEALDTINPKRAHGRLQDLWIDFAKYFEKLATDIDSKNPDLSHSRSIFDRSLLCNFKHPENLAECYIAYAEFELRHEQLQKAFDILARGTACHHRSHALVSFRDDSLSAQDRLFKSLKLWNFLVDLEETFGTVERVKACYDRMMELKIVTPQTVINYAVYLEDNQYFEEAFKVYERGVDLFGYPIAFDIWNIYLAKFVKRYGGSKLERARDLFEQALKECPEQYAKAIHLMYAKLEEDFGLAKRALNIYDRMTQKVTKEERFEAFNLYIAKATDFFGLPFTRPIFERAIEVLPNSQAKQMCIRFAELELKLGEIDRARAIYAHCSQFCDPRIDTSFWKQWHAFEVRHGNEETFKEMLRIKRSVQALYNTDASFVTSQVVTSTEQHLVNADNEEEQKLAERQAALAEDGVFVQRPTTTFVSGGKTMNGKSVEDEDSNEPQTVKNPEEIKMDDDAMDLL